MKTIKADAKGRVQIPGIKAGHAFVIEDRGNGVFVLTDVKKAAKDPFPKGSLKHLFTKEANAEMKALARGMKIPAPPEDWD
jgi:hypothetical protein